MWEILQNQIGITYRPLVVASGDHLAIRISRTHEKNNESRLIKDMLGEMKKPREISSCIVRTVIQHLIPRFITLVNFICFLALNCYSLDLGNLSRRWTGYFQAFLTWTSAIVGQPSTFLTPFNALECYILDLGDMGLTRGRWSCIWSILDLLAGFITTLSLPLTSIISPVLL